MSERLFIGLCFAAIPILIFGGGNLLAYIVINAPKIAQNKWVWMCLASVIFFLIGWSTRP